MVNASWGNLFALTTHVKWEIRLDLPPHAPIKRGEIGVDKNMSMRELSKKIFENHGINYEIEDSGNYEVFNLGYGFKRQWCSHIEYAIGYIPFLPSYLEVKLWTPDERYKDLETIIDFNEKRLFKLVWEDCLIYPFDN